MINIIGLLLYSYFSCLIKKFLKVQISSNLSEKLRRFILLEEIYNQLFNDQMIITAIFDLIIIIFLISLPTRSLEHNFGIKN